MRGWLAGAILLSCLAVAGTASAESYPPPEVGSVAAEDDGGYACVEAAAPDPCPQSCAGDCVDGCGARPGEIGPSPRDLGLFGLLAGVVGAGWALRRRGRVSRSRG